MKLGFGTASLVGTFGFYDPSLGASPRAVVTLANYASALDAQTPNAALAVGLSDGVQQSSYCDNIQDGQIRCETSRKHRSDDVVALSDPGVGTYFARADFGAFVQGGANLVQQVADAPILVSGLLVDSPIALRTFDFSAAEPGFVVTHGMSGPYLVLAHLNHANAINNGGVGFNPSHGVAYWDGSVLTQMCGSWYAKDASQPSKTYCALSDDCVLARGSALKAGARTYRYAIMNPTNDGFDIVSLDEGGGAFVTLLVIGLGQSQAKVAAVDLPSGPGEWAAMPALGFNPQACGFIGTLNSSLNTSQTSEGGCIGWANLECSGMIAYTTQNNASPVLAKSYHSNSKLAYLQAAGLDRYDFGLPVSFANEVRLQVSHAVGGHKAIMWAVS